MNIKIRTKKSLKTRRYVAGMATALLLGSAAAGAQAQITSANWGTVTAPVYGQLDSYPSGLAGVPSPELLAGPNKFGTGYYNGVLPNGKIVTPAGQTIQIGMNPLNAALTPDGKYLITTNDDERDGGFTSLQSLSDPTIINKGGYSLSVIDTSSMKVVSQIAGGAVFIGLQIAGPAGGPYTVYASGGPNQTNGAKGVIRLFTVSGAGAIAVAATPTISLDAILPSNQGYVSHYTSGLTGPATTYVPSPGSTAPGAAVFAAGAQITFPAGSALSPDGRYLYVACNGDNSLAMIDTTTNTVVKQIPVGYFPYTVAVSNSGKVLVSNWGVTQYKFKNPTYDANGVLTALPPAGAATANGTEPDGYYVPATSTTGGSPKTSSISVLAPATAGDPTTLNALGAIYEGKPLDNLYTVGGTHPSAMAIVRRGPTEVLYVTKSNSDSLGMMLVNTNKKLADFDLSPVSLTLANNQKVHGAYPNALAVSPDNTRLYVAEAGTNTVAVLDTTNPYAPVLLGRIPTGSYPTALAVSPDGQSLYITNAKGISEDINPATTPAVGVPPPTGIESYSDGNFIFGSLQKVNLASAPMNGLSNDYAVQASVDTSVVPAGGSTPSAKINHVIFILHENKTFDSMLGNLGTGTADTRIGNHFGNFASLTYNNAGQSTTAPNGTPFTNKQYTGVSLNTQLLASTFGTAVNYYSDSEESDAGHQFCASGTASDYTEKTLLVKAGRGLLVNKNFEPEDYPEGGYIFNNAARNGVSFKDYGAFVRIDGTDTGASAPTTLNDINSGEAGVPSVDANNNVVLDGSGHVVNRVGDDVTTAVGGLGQSYFLALPILEILGENNTSSEPHLDHSYPGYNFNISDQRRAQEFIADFDRMSAAGTLPQFIYLYQPNDHTGSVQAPNAAGINGINLVADGDVGLGMVIDHILKSPAYYTPESAPGKGDDKGSAIFITYDDAQSSLDHIHQHRTPLIVVSPFAKPGYLGTRHYSTASVVKTEELLLGLPPNNLGDLFATDLRDMFQSTYNGITANSASAVVAGGGSLDNSVTKMALYKASPESLRIWKLVAKLDTSAPDRDSYRLGVLNRLCVAADALRQAAVKKHHLGAAMYKATQARFYQMALKAVGAPARETDD